MLDHEIHLGGSFQTHLFDTCLAQSFSIWDLNRFVFAAFKAGIRPSNTIKTNEHPLISKISPNITIDGK